MKLKPSRLRRGEIIAAIGAVVLLALLFLVPWFSVDQAGGAHTDATGWSSMPTLRWPIMVTAACALLLAFLQASRPAPALPVTMSVIVTTLGAVTTLALIIRIPTDAASPLAGAFLGLAAAAGLTVGAFLSLRQEGGWLPDQDHPIELMTVGPPQGGS